MTPLEVEESRVRYFLEQSKIDQDGIDNVIRCFKDAHASALAAMIRESEGRPPVHATQASKATYRWHALRNARLIDPGVTE